MERNRREIWNAADTLYIYETPRSGFVPDLCVHVHTQRDSTLKTVCIDFKQF